ncbi:MAG: excinuclease ABC subunit UvrA, partial [Planctomycetes bacterium]|nr:excinuclease ABC subunit UvrA [Planctomycetota bacterium]
MKSIIARGIRVHNLKNIDVEIPLRELVVITGVSGSGKSSLAFDTLYAEGQRRYVETFSAYARQFLERMDKPDVDHIEGIPPAIAIQQRNPVKNRRSTVGTATEINDYLRLLFARIGETYCEKCGRLIESDTVSRVMEQVLSLPEGTKFLVTFPVNVSQKLSSKMQISALKERGLVRLMADGAIIDLTTGTPPDIRHFKSVAGVVDRLVVKADIKERLADAVEMAYRLGNGQLCIVQMRNKVTTPQSPPSQGGDKGEVSIIEEMRFSKHFRCDYCNIEYPESTPLLFSFNNPIGACPKCEGFGNIIEIDMDLVVPDKEKTINQGAIAPWNTHAYESLLNELQEAAQKYNIPLDVPFKQLSKEQIQLIMEGTKDFCGIREFFDWLEQKKYKMHVRVFLSKYRGYAVCQMCNGTRLNNHARNVKINGVNIADICAMTVEDASNFFSASGGLTLTKYKEELSSLLLNEIRKRLDYMVKIGLGYITLDRLTRTLSGGEAQRVNLTTSLGSSLVNVLYILDEPSIGLHPRDTKRLIQTLERLRDIGNTVLVVEHDREMMKSADEIIDMGPGAGENGGTIVYQGTLRDMPAEDSSLTGMYLKGRRTIELPPVRRKPTNKAITLKGASQNNLKHIEVAFPLNMFVCVTGVSGSGKSTLVQDTLYAALKRRKFAQSTSGGGESAYRFGGGGFSGVMGKHEGIIGANYISDVIMVDQSPIGRTPRSNPITYIKVYDEIRKLFASTRDARIRNFGPGYFSFNVPGGRCNHCDGDGYRKVDMQFLADVYVICEECHGKRFQKETLEIRYKHKNIHEVLEMSIDEAINFFADAPRIINGLKYLQATGLGYLRLGQPATTLSGGEAQRLKLAAYMATGGMEEILFIFDEPTTGLHFDDINKLLACFQQLIAEGHSVVVIEHNLDVIKCADYIIDLGPEGGEKGGYVIGSGTPEKITRLKN